MRTYIDPFECVICDNCTHELASSQAGIELESEVENWVGIGDAVDYFKIALNGEADSSQRLAITLDEETALAVEEGILKITCVNDKGGNLALGELEAGQLYVKKSLAGAEAIYVGVTLKSKTEDSVDYSFAASLVTLS